LSIAQQNVKKHFVVLGVLDYYDASLLMFAQVTTDSQGNRFKFSGRVKRAHHDASRAHHDASRAHHDAPLLILKRLPCAASACARNGTVSAV
jgi:hypothetical protein